MKKRTEITITHQRILVIRQRRDSVRASCPTCAREVRMLTPEEAAAVIKASARTICRLIKAGQLHFIERGEEDLLICLNSLDLLQKSHRD